MSASPRASDVELQEASAGPVGRPPAIPPPDLTRIEDLNASYDYSSARKARSGLRQRLIWLLRDGVRRLLLPQVQFNAAVVDHLNRNAKLGIDAHVATMQMIKWIEQSFAEVEMSSNDMKRYRDALLARDARASAAIASLTAAHDDIRASVGVLQVTAQSLKREVERLAHANEAGRTAGDGSPGVSPPAPAAPTRPAAAMDSYKYVGFEDQFRGSQEDIRQRQLAYLPVFAGRSDVVDIGCGRGEFLALLRENGITARGVDVNRAMVEMCAEKGLDATESDAVTFLRSLPDASLGGLIAAQVVEHLDPPYLGALLDAAYAKLRPGSPIVLETINPACWYAFFESYLRDITHAQPLHPDTLKYLMMAAGFHSIDIRFSAPYPAADKLQEVTTAPGTALADLAETLNANVEKINRLLFTWLDYAAVGLRP